MESGKGLLDYWGLAADSLVNSQSNCRKENDADSLGGNTVSMKMSERSGWERCFCKKA